MKYSTFRERKKIERPETLSQLLRMASTRVWQDPTYEAASYAHVRDAIEIMGDPKLDKIDTLMVDDYIQIVSEGVRPSTVNRKLSALRTLLKYAYDREWVQKLPKFSWQKEDNERFRWLKPEEETTLLALLPSAISAFCEILIHTGMRRGELLSMEREQLDGNYARLWKTKTRRPRSVPLSPRAKELLEQWLPFDLTKEEVSEEWNKARKAMGLENDRNFVLHMLRHTTATRMLETTSNIALVSKMLGHSKLTTTMRYAHTSDDALLEAVMSTAKAFETAKESAC